jgi:hypothetical protein
MGWAHPSVTHHISSTLKQLSFDKTLEYCNCMSTNGLWNTKFDRLFATQVPYIIYIDYTYLLPTDYIFQFEAVWNTGLERPIDWESHSLSAASLSHSNLTAHSAYECMESIGNTVDTIRFFLLFHLCAQYWNAFAPCTTEAFVYFFRLKNEKIMNAHKMA